MDAKEAYAMGREFAEAGMPARAGLAFTSERNGCGRLLDNELGHYAVLDFRDELTALATILWVKSVCEAKWGHLSESQFIVSEGGNRREHRVEWRNKSDSGAFVLAELGTGPTLPHACLAAVKAARGPS